MPRKDDLLAAKKALEDHLEVLKVTIEFEKYSESCRALRALQDECNNALRIAGSLSLEAYLHNDKRR